MQNKILFFVVYCSIAFATAPEYLIRREEYLLGYEFNKCKKIEEKIIKTYIDEGNYIMALHKNKNLDLYSHLRMNENELATFLSIVKNSESIGLNFWRKANDYFKLGYYLCAKDIYEFAETILKNSATAYYNIGACYLRKADLFKQNKKIYNKFIDLALRWTLASVKANSSVPIAWRNLGLIYELKKNHKKAIECYRKSLELDPSQEDLRKIIKQGN